MMTASLCALAGCATGHWIKAGADPQAFSADRERCTLDSWRATPEPEWQEGPARAYPRTQDEMQRLAERDKAGRGSYSQCLRERGWRWQPLS